MKKNKHYWDCVDPNFKAWVSGFMSEGGDGWDDRVYRAKYGGGVVCHIRVTGKRFGLVHGGRDTSAWERMTDALETSQKKGGAEVVLRRKSISMYEEFELLVMEHRIEQEERANVCNAP